MAAPHWHRAQTIFTVSMSTRELLRDGFYKKAQHGLTCLFQWLCQCKQPAVQTHDDGRAAENKRRESLLNWPQSHGKRCFTRQRIKDSPSSDWNGPVCSPSLCLLI